MDFFVYLFAKVVDVIVKSAWMCLVLRCFFPAAKGSSK